MKIHNLFNNLAQDRSICRNKIHLVDPASSGQDYEDDLLLLFIRLIPISKLVNILLLASLRRDDQFIKFKRESLLWGLSYSIYVR